MTHSTLTASKRKELETLIVDKIVRNASAIDSRTKSFKGGFLLYRKAGAGLAKPGHKSQARNPRFRHPTFAAAEAEANRLLPNHPESTFIIMQEVATVKACPVIQCDGCGTLVPEGLGKRWADDAVTCAGCSPNDIAKGQADG